MRYRITNIILHVEKGHTTMMQNLIVKPIKVHLLLLYYTVPQYEKLDILFFCLCIQTESHDLNVEPYHIYFMYISTPEPIISFFSNNMAGYVFVGFLTDMFKCSIKSDFAMSSPLFYFRLSLHSHHIIFSLVPIQYKPTMRWYTEFSFYVLQFSCVAIKNTFFHTILLQNNYVQYIWIHLSSSHIIIIHFI